MKREDWNKRFAEWCVWNTAWDLETALEVAADSTKLFEHYPTMPEEAAKDAKFNCQS